VENKFPPDYKLFLKVLLSTDRPLLVTRFNKRNQPFLKEFPSFNNWLTDTREIKSATKNLLDGILFDVEENKLWLKGWGSRPSLKSQRRLRLQKLLKNAPKIIPISGHQFLLLEPNKSGNPIFSIHQSDIICYGSDLRYFLLIELADLLGIDRYKIFKESARSRLLHHTSQSAQ